MEKRTPGKSAVHQLVGGFLCFLLGVLVTVLYLDAMPKVLFAKSVANFDVLYLQCASALQLEHELTLSHLDARDSDAVRPSVNTAKLSCLDLKLLSTRLTSRGISKDALIARGIELAKRHPELLPTENEVLRF